MSTEAYRILLSALSNVRRGEFFTADDWHDQAHHAHLKSAEKGSAHQQAIDDGYLERIVVRIGNRTAAVQVPSTIPSRKSGGVQLHVRTGRALPGEPAPTGAAHERAEVPGQLDLLEVS